MPCQMLLAPLRGDQLDYKVPHSSTCFSTGFRDPAEAAIDENMNWDFSGKI